MAQQIKNLTPQQRQAVLMQAQNEANMKIRAELLNKIVASCYDKCAGTSVSQTCTYRKEYRSFFMS